jgi:hypothetical protein
MANEEKIKPEELSDEQLNEASGGSAPTAGDPSKKSRKCANPNCNKILPAGYIDDLCIKCKNDAQAGFHIVNHFEIPER